MQRDVFWQLQLSLPTTDDLHASLRVVSVSDGLRGGRILPVCSLSDRRVQRSMRSRSPILWHPDVHRRKLHHRFACGESGWVYPHLRRWPLPRELHEEFYVRDFCLRWWRL